MINIKHQIADEGTLQHIITRSAAIDEIETLERLCKSAELPFKEIKATKNDATRVCKRRYHAGTLRF